MGETHTSSQGCKNLSSCITMNNFISKLGDDKCIDIFIEDVVKVGQGYRQTDTKWYDEKDEEPSDVTIAVMRKLTRSLENNKNIRIHNWDLRHSDNYGVDFIDLDNEIMDGENMTRKFPYLDMTSKLIYFKYLLGYEDVTQREFIKVVSTILGRGVTDMMADQLKILRQKVIDEYKKFKKTEHEYFLSKLDLRDFFLRYIFKKVESDPQNLTLAFTDLYTLCRMFRTFGNKRKGSCIGQPYLDRIVFYAGSRHAKTFLAVINYYFPDAIKCQVSSPSRGKILSFDKDIEINKGYNNFSDFLSWPS